MAVARHSEDIELQEEDTNYENDTTTTARRIQTEIAAEGHYERLDLQKIDDAVYEDLKIKTKKEKDLEKILQSGQQTVGRRLKDAAPWILCVILALLAVVTGLAVHYNSDNKQLQIRLDNFVLELEERLQHEVNQLREAADKVCPNGWQKFGFRCYQRSPEAKTWEKSRQHCLKAGGDLVIINRQKEQEFIKELSSGKGGSWIGLNKTEGKWTWVDGKPLTTGYWASGRPKNNTNNNCVKYNHNQGDWEDAICEEDFRFICEK